jgi:hypothetical protein
MRPLHRDDRGDRIQRHGQRMAGAGELHRRPREP